MIATLALSVVLLRPPPIKAHPKAKPGPAPTALLAPGKPSTGPGQVSYQTADATFVDRGSADGIKVGDTLTISRRGKPVGGCAVTAATLHGAICNGKGFLAGDRIAIERSAPESRSPLAALPGPDAFERARAQLGASGWEPVDFNPHGLRSWGGRGAPTVEIVLGHTTASNSRSSNGPYQVEQLDVVLRDLRIWRGLHVSLDLTAMEWSRRPADHGSPLDSNTQLFVHQAELTWHDPDSMIVAAVGRTEPQHAPGLTVIDGAQVGVRSLSDRFEAGAFGGLLPDPLGLRFSTQSWTVGAYATARFFSGSGPEAIWFQPELRAGWALREGIGGRFEVAGALHGFVGQLFDVHTLVQAGLGSSSAIDLARVDLGARLFDRLRLLGDARYRGSPTGEVLEFGAQGSGNRAWEADLQGVFEVVPGLILAATGGFTRDLDTALWSGRVGPELQLPTALGIGGLSLGYQEELGWLRGRSGYLQASLVPHRVIRVSARAVWYQSLSIENAGVSGHEVGGSLTLDASLTRWLWLRLSGLARTHLDSADLALSGNAQLGADW